ncbi:MAG: hypothetical protein ABI572_01130 [Actinomycetota bacterium]
MSERWKEELDLLDTVAPDVGKLRALAASGPNESPPSDPGPGKRAAIISLSLALALLGFAFVFIALREEPPETTVGSPNASLVPSGGSYGLTDFQVEFPTKPPDGDGPAVALVTFTSRWTSPNFPGEAPCTIRLLDADDRALATLETGLTAMMREDPGQSVEIEVPSGIPATAEGECGPGVIFDGSSQYVFSNLAVEEDRITGDIAWSAGSPVGEAACAARVADPDGNSIIQVFTLGAGPGADRTIVLLPGKFPDSGTAEVRCEPYRTEEQLQEGYWSPWTPSPVPTAEDIVEGRAPIGEPLAELLGLKLEPSFEAALPCTYWQGVGEAGGYCLAGLDMGEIDEYAIALALRGHRITQDELAAITDAFSSPGTGVDDPPIAKIPIIQERIRSVEAELASLDTTTPDGKAKEDVLRAQLAALDVRLGELCREAGSPGICTTAR